VHRNTRTGLRLAVVLMAVAVAGASTSCLGGSTSASGPTSTVAATVVSDSGPPRVLVRPAVANSLRIAWPSDAASGFGSIWISAAAGLTKLDPRSGRVVGTVRIANTGEWTNVAVGGGSVWFGSGGTIVRVDPTSGRVLSRTRFGRDDGTQAFEWIGANADGVCTTQLVAKAGRAAFCFDTNLKRRFVAKAGPGPIAATTSGDIWVGGPTLSSIDIRTRTTHSLAIPRGSKVSALAPDGAGLWAAVEFHRGKAAEIWHIIDRRVVSRTQIDATWVENIAFADGALVVVPYRIGEGQPTAEVVEADGTLRPVATLAKDNHNVLGTPDALWAISYRHNLVTRISRFASRAP
jgi:hypothetical protein